MCVHVCEYWIEHRLSEKEKVKVPFGLYERNWLKISGDRCWWWWRPRRQRRLRRTTTTKKTTNWLNFKLHTLNTIISSYSRNTYTTREVHSMATHTNDAKKWKHSLAAAHMLIWWSIANRTKNRVHENYEQRQRHDSNNYINDDGVDCWRDWTQRITHNGKHVCVTWKICSRHGIYVHFALFHFLTHRKR